MRRTLSLVVGFLVPLVAVAEPGPAPREVRFDRDGDRLPDGAVARLGTRRFRDPGADRLFVFDSGKVVACFNESAVRWWDLQTGRYLRGWAAPGGRPAWDKPGFSPDGKVAAVVAGDRLEVWDAWNDRRLRTFELDTSRRVVAGPGPPPYQVGPPQPPGDGLPPDVHPMVFSQDDGFRLTGPPTAGEPELGG